MESGESGHGPGREPAPPTGRNEPCPCGSGKKYKRCHGVGAAPKLTAPRNPAGGQDPAEMQKMLGSMDPEMIKQMGQMFQRMPRGQMQRLQALMQKAMAGKDVSREAAELEGQLPPEMQQMMRMMGTMAGAGQPMEAEPADTAAEGSMSEEKARALVAQAAAEGKISQEQAAALLKTEKEPKRGGFFKGFRSSS